MSGSADSPARVDLGLFGWLNRLMLGLIVVALIALIVLKYLPLLRKNEAMNLELQMKTEEVQRLEAEALRRQVRNEQLRSDPRTNEREAREKLGLARPDEQVIKFEGEPAAPPRR